MGAAPSDLQNQQFKAFLDFHERMMQLYVMRQRIAADRRPGHVPYIRAINRLRKTAGQTDQNDLQGDLQLYHHLCIQFFEDESTLLRKWQAWSWVKNFTPEMENQLENMQKDCDTTVLEAMQLGNSILATESA